MDKQHLLDSLEIKVLTKLHSLQDHKDLSVRVQLNHHSVKPEQPSQLLTKLQVLKQPLTRGQLDNNQPSTKQADNSVTRHKTNFNKLLSNKVPIKELLVATEPF